MNLNDYIERAIRFLRVEKEVAWKRSGGFTWDEIEEVVRKIIRQGVEQAFIEIKTEMQHFLAEELKPNGISVPPDGRLSTDNAQPVLTQGAIPGHCLDCSLESDICFDRDCLCHKNLNV